MKKSTYLIALALGASTITFAQNVGINTDGTDPDSDALLHVKDNNADSSVVRVENEQSKLTKFDLRNPSAKWDLRIPTGATDLRINNGSGQDHVTIQNDGDVGIGTTTPVSGLDVQTSMGLAHAAVSADVTLDEDDNVVLVDDAGADRTITLPLASGNSGRVYYIKKTSSSENKITIQRNTSATIDGATSVVLYVQYDAIRILCDGTNWHIIGDERKAHICALRKTAAAQSIPNGLTTTKVLLTDEDVDVGGIGDPTTNNRIDIKRAGNYYIDAYGLLVDLEASGQVVIRVRINGVNQLYSTNYNGSAGVAWTDAKVSKVLNLSAGDFVELTIEHSNSFGALNTYQGLVSLSVMEIR